MIIPVIPKWGKNEEEFREDGKAIIRFELGIDYEEICGNIWPKMIYKCLYDPTIKSWMTENTDIVSIYNADSLDELCYLIQEDLILDSVIYDIFYCYIEENR